LVVLQDQVRNFYAIVQDEVGKTESHLRNIEAQMERMQDTHRNDIRIYLQKVIHLEYEHENNVESVAALAQGERDASVAAHESATRDLRDLKLSLKGALHKSEVAHEEEIKRLKEVERKEMQKLREQFERNYAELLSSYETRLSNLRDDLDLRQKMEIHEIEERKNRHINDLMIHHEKNFQEMRNYYNSITQDNLDLIKELNVSCLEQRGQGGGTKGGVRCGCARSGRRRRLAATATHQPQRMQQWPRQHARKGALACHDHEPRERAHRESLSRARRGGHTRAGLRLQF